MSKKFTSPSEFPSDLVLSGTFIARQKEHREWTKDGVSKQMDVLLLFVQCPSGIYACRSFNPSYDFADFKVGDSISLPIAEFKLENAIKSVIFRC